MKKIGIEIKWAFVFIAVCIAWMSVERLLGLHDEHIDKYSFYTNFFSIAAIGVYVLALLDKRKRYYQGVMTFKQGFISGLIITLIVVLLNPFVQWFIYSIVTPDFYQNIIEHFTTSGEMTMEQAENYFKLSNYILRDFVVIPIMGGFSSAIISLFVKKKQGKQEKFVR